MRRIRLRTGPTALFGAFFVAALILLLPMRLALGWFGVGDAGLTARAVNGSVWSGALTEAHAAGLDLGDLKAGVSPIQLLVGRARVDLAGRDDPPATPLKGAVSISRHSIGIDDVSAGVDAASAFAPLPVSKIDLDDVSARFQEESCDHAEGRVRATLGGQVAGVPLPQEMSGTARCDGKALLLPLTSVAGTEALTLRLSRDGSYSADLTLRPGDPGAAEKLQAAGFSQTPAGYMLSLQGQF